MSEEYLALIPAAGVGSRAQLKLAKQFTEIGSKTIIEYALDPFLADENCKKICVVTQEDNDVWTSLPISGHEKIVSCVGGETRMQSVLKGLENLMETEDKGSLVAIHDAARPCLLNSDLKKLIDFAADEMKDEGQGVFLAHQPPESVSLGDKNKVTKSLDRSKVWLSATPQVFFLEDILKAVENAKDTDKFFSDEVGAAFSFFKSNITPILSDRMNIKVTKKEDLVLVEQYLKLSGRL
ncbi:MAG: IspD/TarI family cytidylyltransferase [Pseudomonadota bacterium]|nr:IspD/TarI family cytidylyltransferase [Pseudomonadota bacterium]